MKESKLKTIGIGSLPFKDLQEAINYSLNHDIPFAPQLDFLDGSMISQAKHKSYKALKIMINDFSPPLIKTQIVGPKSSGLSLQLLKDNICYQLDIIGDTKKIIFIDEPHLDFSKLTPLYQFAKDRFDYVGVHCCNSDLNPSDINSFHPDIFSFDSILNDIEEELSDSIELAFGCVNPFSMESKKPLRKSGLISACCGLNDSCIDPAAVLDKLNSFHR